MIPIRDTIPSRHVPVTTWALIAINVTAFFWQLTLPAEAARNAIFLFGIVPARFTNPSWAADVGFPHSFLPFITTMFLHGGWLHVIGNMWVLWIFGDNVEDRMGHARFLVFYVLCGILAGAAHVYFNPQSVVPTIGASGAIAGVMGAYFVLYPRAKVITLIPILFYPLFVELPAYVFLGVWFAAQLLSGTASMVAPEEAGGIAFLAHVGGFVAGVLLHWPFLRRSER